MRVHYKKNLDESFGVVRPQCLTVLVCCLLLDACPVLPSQLDNAINTATPNTQVFTEHNQVFNLNNTLVNL